MRCWVIPAGGVARRKRCLEDRGPGFGKYPPRKSAPRKFAPRKFAPGKTAVGKFAPGKTAVGKFAPGKTAVGKFAPGKTAVGKCGRCDLAHSSPAGDQQRHRKWT